MIRLEISGDTAQEFGAQLSAVAQLMAGGAATLPAAEPEAPGKSASRGKAKTAPAATATEADTSTANQSSASAPAKETPADPTGGAGTADSGAPSAATGAAPATREDVQKRCVEYGKPANGGPQGLRELLVAVGAPNGKWSEITDAMLPELNARLDELLK